MAYIKIHRGTHQIGGTITEISTDRATIFIDFGSELSVEPEQSTDGQMIEMIKSCSNCKGVFFSHYHGDHVGLLSEIPESVPLYMGAVARKILLNIRKALLSASKNPNASINNLGKVKKEYEILRDDTRIRTFSDNGVIQDIDGMTIIPHMTDHSAFDAYMFQIEVNGKTILHTGDFRTHGRLGPILQKHLNGRLSNVKIDILLTEGTMMSRPGEKIPTEDELLEEARKTLALPKNKYSFLLCSSTNMDSLATFCYAAHRLGRPFLVNSYVYQQLMLYRENATDLHRIYYFPHTYELSQNLAEILPNGQTQEEFMRQHGFLMLIGQTEYYESLMDRFAQDDPLLIYSMWDGYLTSKNPLIKNDRLIHLTQKYRFEALHTSGHATTKDIIGLIHMTKPDVIIPIHTERGEKFKELDNRAFAEHVQCLNDGDQWDF